MTVPALGFRTVTKQTWLTDIPPISLRTTAICERGDNTRIWLNSNNYFALFLAEPAGVDGIVSSPRAWNRRNSSRQAQASVAA